MAGRLGFSQQKPTGGTYVFILIDVGMTPRKWDGFEAADAAAGSRTRPRAVSRALSVLF